MAMDNPHYLLDGNEIDDPEELESQLTPEEQERIQSLEPGESTTIGGGAFAEWAVERVQ